MRKPTSDRRLKRTLIALALVVAVGAFVAFFVLPAAYDARANPFEVDGPYTVSRKADSLHQSLRIVDLHADQLLWGRPTHIRSARGHVDVPRLQSGNVALQVFSAVTKSPKGQNNESNPSNTDRLTPLLVLQRWPARTWKSLNQRALYQAKKLERAEEVSKGALRIVRTKADLERLLDDRRRGRTVLGGLLAIEGLHSMEGTMDGYESLFAAGYRMMATTHFFDNELGGSAHGIEKGGLTELGRQTIRRMEEDGVVVDLAHVSPTSISEILDMATKPVVVSHTGVKGTCPGTRNLSDEHIDRIAQNNGIIGIGFWKAAVCGTDPTNIVRAIRYVADRVGVEHVALGSDFDGSVGTHFHAAGMALVTEALLEDGFSEADVRLIMGENTLRVFLEVLP